MVPLDHSRFDGVLAELEESGGSLLVVGTVPDERFTEVTESILDDVIDVTPRRLFVTTAGKGPGLHERFSENPGLTNRENARAIRITDTGQNPSANADTTGTGIPVRDVSPQKIDVLAQEILQTLEEIEESTGDLASGDLGVSIETLSALIDRHGQEPVFRMVHILNHLFEERRGIAFYHLPVERESGVVRQFEPLFDAVIELRLQDDALEQRWHLREAELTSEWISG